MIKNNILSRVDYV